MTEGAVMLIGRGFFQAAVEIAGPVLVVAVVAGVSVSVAQVLTSVQDMTLAFVVRIAAVSLVLAFVGQWMLHRLVQYTIRLWEDIPQLIG
jgi:flagellar biosynthetic protein FliQ